MTKVSACEIFNQIDKKNFTLYVEWLDSNFKVMLLEPSMLPLSGQMDVRDIDFFCCELDKSHDKYLQETEEILCGKDKEIQFFVENTTLEWKKNVWTVGRIKLFSVLDVKVIAEHFQRSLKFYQSIQDKLNVLEKENENLTNIKKKLCSDIENMIEVKTNMEQDLYRKFVLILNSKKQKLRELENAIKEKQGSKDSVFDVCTDESAESDEEMDEINNRTIRTAITKRKSFNEFNSASVQKAKRTNFTINTDHVFNDETSPKISTARYSVPNKVHDSKNCAAEGNEGTNEQQSCVSGTRKSRSSLNFVEEESEEEFS